VPHLYRRGKYWWVKIYLDGRPVWRSLRLRTSETSKRQAQQAAYELERRLKAGKGLLNLPRLDWIAAAEQYLNYFRSKDQYRPRTYESRKQKIEAWLQFVGPRNIVPQNEASARQQVIDYLRSRLRDRSAATVNADRRYLHHFFGWLMRAGVVPWQQNPASASLIEVPKPERRVPEVLTPDEDRLLAGILRDTGLWRHYCLMRFAGLRTTEMLSLQWESVDLDQGILRILRTKTHEDRIVPISGDLVEEIATWERRGPYVAPSPMGKFWLRRNFLRKWRTVVKRAGLPAKMERPYILRRTCISRALEAGMPPQIAAKIFGHTVATMMRYYANLRVEEAGRFLSGPGTVGAAVGKTDMPDNASPAGIEG